jgi:hypothetical protein
MYFMLTAKHPLYIANDTKAKYLEKLRAPNWTFPKTFNLMA